MTVYVYSVAAASPNSTPAEQFTCEDKDIVAAARRAQREHGAAVTAVRVATPEEAEAYRASVAATYQRLYGS